MDIEQMKLLFNLTNEQVKLAEDYFLKAEKAQILHCEMHDTEFMDFEPGCYACIQEMTSSKLKGGLEHNE